MMLKSILLAGAGGAVGSIARYIISIMIKSSLPVATLLVNVTGSFLLGFFAGIALKYNWDQQWKVLLISGICGGFTTFSAFSYENLQLIQQGKIILCVAYVLLSVIAAIFAVYLGYRIANI